MNNSIVKTYILTLTSTHNFRTNYLTIQYLLMALSVATTGMYGWWITLLWYLVIHNMVSSDLLFPKRSRHTRRLIVGKTYYMRWNVIPPQAFCNMPLLEHLVLDSLFLANKDVLNVNSLCCLSHLVHLDLSNNNIQQLPWGVFSNLAALRTLILTGKFVGLVQIKLFEFRGK